MLKNITRNMFFMAKGKDLQNINFCFSYPIDKIYVLCYNVTTSCGSFFMTFRGRYKNSENYQEVPYES